MSIGKVQALGQVPRAGRSVRLGPFSRQAPLLPWGLALALGAHPGASPLALLPWAVEEGLDGPTAFLWLEQERDKGSILGPRKSI